MVFPYITHAFLDKTGTFGLDNCPCHGFLIKLVEIVASWDYETLVVFEVGIAVLGEGVSLCQFDVSALQDGPSSHVKNKASFTTAALLLADAAENENFVGGEGD